MESYRSISLLPTMSKAVEKLILDKITAFINDADTLQNRLMGFRRQRGTGHAAAGVTTNIQLAANGGHVAAEIVVDTKKVFHKV